MENILDKDYKKIISKKTKKERLLDEIELCYLEYEKEKMKDIYEDGLVLEGKMQEEIENILNLMNAINYTYGKKKEEIKLLIEKNIFNGMHIELVYMYYEWGIRYNSYLHINKYKNLFYYKDASKKLDIANKKYLKKYVKTSARKKYK